MNKSLNSTISRIRTHQRQKLILIQSHQTILRKNNNTLIKQKITKLINRLQRIQRITQRNANARAIRPPINTGMLQLRIIRPQIPQQPKLLTGQIQETPPTPLGTPLIIEIRGLPLTCKL